MLAALNRDAALTRWRSSAAARGAERVLALLLAERVERNVLGMETVGDQVRRDVPQVTLSFVAHRLLDPSLDETDWRRQLRRRAFDHLLTLALARIAAAQTQRADLAQQRDLLRRKCAALERGGWSFGADEAVDVNALHAELDDLEARLRALGSDQHLLHAHLALVAETLADASRQLWVEPRVLVLDALNIQRSPQDPTARRIEFSELHNAGGRHAVMLPVTIALADLPAREDFVAAAERYLM